MTLIELLIVIAIVVALMGLSIPSIRSAREAARRSVCSASLRGFGVAISLYRDDSRGILPYANKLYSLPAGWVEPLEALDPYLDAELPYLDEYGKVVTAAPFLCPSDSTFGQMHGMSYGYVPSTFMQVAAPPREAEAVTAMFVQNPQFAIMWDLDGWHSLSSNGAEGDRNALFLDGSVSVRRTIEAN